MSICLYNALLLQISAMVFVVDQKKFEGKWISMNKDEERLVKICFYEKRCISNVTMLPMALE